MLATLADIFGRTQFFPESVVGCLGIFMTTIRCSILYHTSVIYTVLVAMITQFSFLISCWVTSVQSPSKRHERKRRKWENAGRRQ